jgi:hypothetical protein
MTILVIADNFLGGFNGISVLIHELRWIDSESLNIL